MSSPSINDLFATARGDRPDEGTRDEVWARIAATTGITAPIVVAAAASITPAPATATTGATKLVLASIASAIVTAVAVIVALPAIAGDTAGSIPRRAPKVVATGAEVRTRLLDDAPRARAEAPASFEVFEIPEAAPPAVPAAASPGEAPDGSSLAEEARLVTEARLALVQGEPARALALTTRARRLPARAMEPEELRVTARALQALGRTDEALATELTLRSRFPAHTPSRAR